MINDNYQCERLQCITIYMCKSSNQFNKQETSELLVYIYIKRSRCTPEFHTLIPLSYKIPIYIFTKTYTYYRYDEIKFIELILFCKRGKFLC